jgi:hypothetical protein
MVVVKAVYYMKGVGGVWRGACTAPFAWRIILGLSFLLLFSCYLEELWETGVMFCFAGSLASGHTTYIHHPLFLRLASSGVSSIPRPCIPHVHIQLPLMPIRRY